MEIVNASKFRYATKAYQGDAIISSELVGRLLTVLRYSPSSVNSQPWHFVVAATAVGKARVAKAAEGPYQYNQRKILDASHVIVLCARTDITDLHLSEILATEERDGRFQIEGAKAQQQKTRATYLDLHRKNGDVTAWMEKQVYLALGTLLLAAGTLKIDATPMEGFDPETLDNELGLGENGHRGVVLCALGYRADSDFNAQLPKSRLSDDAIFTHL